MFNRIIYRSTKQTEQTNQSMSMTTAFINSLKEAAPSVVHLGAQAVSAGVSVSFTPSTCRPRTHLARTTEESIALLTAMADLLQDKTVPVIQLDVDMASSNGGLGNVLSLLWTGLANNQTVRVVMFESIQGNDQNVFKAAFDAIKKNVQSGHSPLEELHLKRVPLSNKNVLQALSMAVATQFRALEILDCDLGRKPRLSLLWKALKGNASFKVLTVTGVDSVCRMEEASEDDSIQNLLTGNPSLEELRLRDTHGLTKASSLWTYLSHGLAHNDKLACLDLRDSAIGGYEVDQLFGIGVANNSTVERLYLKAADLGAVHALADCLNQVEHSSLKVLMLSRGRQFVEEADATILECFTNNQHIPIETLVLPVHYTPGSSRTPKFVPSELPEFVRSTKHLRHLNIAGYMCERDDHFEDLNRAVQQNRSVLSMIVGSFHPDNFRFQQERSPNRFRIATVCRLNQRIFDLQGGENDVLVPLVLEKLLGSFQVGREYSPISYTNIQGRIDLELAFALVQSRPILFDRTKM